MISLANSNENTVHGLGLDRHEIRFDHRQIMVVNAEYKGRVDAGIYQAQEIALSALDSVGVEAWALRLGEARIGRATSVSALTIQEDVRHVGRAPRGWQSRGKRSVQLEVKVLKGGTVIPVGDEQGIPGGLVGRARRTVDAERSCESISVLERVMRVVPRGAVLGGVKAVGCCISGS